MKKNVAELDIEALLAELEKDTESTQFRSDGVQGDFLTFCNVFCLKHGDEMIPIRVLHKIYKTWSKDPLTNTKFTLQLKQVFDLDRYGVKFNESEFKLKRTDWVYFFSKSANPAYEKDDRKTFEAFIKKFEIKKGDIPISISAIDNLYTQFDKRQFRKLSTIRLAKYLRVYFEEIETQGGHYILLSDAIWTKLNKEIYYEKEKSKKIKKKQRTVSSVDPGNEHEDPTGHD